MMDGLAPYEVSYRERQQKKAEQRAARQAEEDARRQREHEAWERFCGLLSPIGRLR